MIFYGVFSIVVSLVLIYSSIGMYKDKMIKTAISIDLLSTLLIVLAVLGFVLPEDYHMYLTFLMLAVVLALVIVYFISNKKNPKNRK